MTRRLTDADFDARTVPGPNTGCILWLGAYLRDYGTFGQRGRGKLLAHRYSYERSVGVIPPGMNVLHHCDTPACVNPGHLFLGTLGENNLDRDRKGRCRSGCMNAGKTHCPNGHEYTPENAYYRANGGRQCRVCERESGRVSGWERARRRASLAIAVVAVGIVSSCSYMTGPDAKYQACQHVEYRDSFALGDTIRTVHIACPKRK